jgi:hypothetical protein
MANSGTPTSDERILLDGLVEQLSRRVPRSWRFEYEYLDGPPYPGIRPDAVLRINAPDGRGADVGVDIRRRFYPRDAYTMSSQLGNVWPGETRPSGRRALPPGLAGLLVLSPFLTERARVLLIDAGLSYADATGNIRVDLANPPIFLMLQGARTNPNPPDKALRSLRGKGAASVVRALLDFRPPYTLRDLALRAGLPLGTASRTITFLIDEALVFRDDERGPIERVDWPGLLRRWTRDYSMLETNTARFYLDPRGPRALLSRLQTLPSPYALTGSLAVPREARVAEPALAAVYVPDARRAASELDLRSVPGTGNVVLLEAPDEDWGRRPAQVDGFPTVALSQVAADLLTSPGRGPAEAEALIAWMGGNEGAWRLG